VTETAKPNIHIVLVYLCLELL